VFIDPICYKTLQGADRNRAIQLSTIAFLFTRVVTNTPNRGRKGIIFFDYIERLFISTRLDQGNVALGTCLCRTGVLAGAGPPFGDKKGIGNSLRIRPVNGLSLIQSLIECIRKKDGANLCTIVTTGAFLHIHITGMSSNPRLEMSSLPFQRDKFRVGDDFNIEMSTCLYQFWRDDAHGAVIGGKGFIQLSHLPTDRRGPL
jgi:hypothetical protein